MRKFLGIVLLMVFAAALITGCSRDSGATGAATGVREIRVALESDIAALDPRNGLATITASFLNHVFNALVVTDAQMNPMPGLAHRYEQLDDWTWRFYLREGVQFHDGSIFTSQDVVYTFDSLRDTSRNWGLAGDFSFIYARAVDRYTVDIYTADPFPGLLLRLNYVMMLPKDYIARVGYEAFANHPVGTGPFRFVSWHRDERVVIEAFDDYWGGRAPVDRIVFRVIPEAASRIAALEAGEVMYITAIPTAEKARLDAIGRLNVVAFPTSRIQFLNFNLLIDSPLRDIRVRQAINHAINRDLLIKGVLDGFGMRVASVSTPEYDGFDPNIRGFEYDPARARRLMAEAGFPNGFTIEASFPTGAANGPEVMTFIAAQLSEIGIRMVIREMAASQQRDMIIAGTALPLYFLALGGPYANIDLISRITFGTGERWSSYSNPAFDELRRQASITIDQAERDRLNSRIQQFILDDAAGVILYQHVALHATSGQLRGWEPRVDELRLFRNSYIAD